MLGETVAPLHPEDLLVSLDPYRGRPPRRALVRGWHARHSASPTLADQVARARCSATHTLMFRGDKTRPEHDVFVFGVKARPALFRGDIKLWRYNVDDVAQHAERFNELLEAFTVSPMIQRDTNAPAVAARVRSEYERGTREQRVRLSLGLTRFRGHLWKARMAFARGPHGTKDVRC